MIAHESLSIQRDHERRHERCLRILAMYSRGERVARIADAYAVSNKTVLRLARAAGFPKRSKRLIDDETRAQAIAALRRGDRLKDIAAALDVSEAWVSLLAKSNGLARYGQERAQ